MWPYTYMDCDFNKIINFGSKGYCDGLSTNPEGKEITCEACKKECVEKWQGELKNPLNEIVAHLGGMEKAMTLYASYLIIVVLRDTGGNSDMK